ncbi:putative integral membrane protein [Cryptosporangium arvum DSM 44712]|uniref:Putative integral membrane protein n=2 Tax=Cryptosporangium TaxID=65502 RepID=A0A011ADL7_9ACTN|nr:putative integral membrane protein [Cryptosporangium arvum DSM 44712]
MQCAQIRLALSALADREEPGTDRADVDAHLAGCAECRTWHAAAAEATDAARAAQRPAAHVPDLTEQVLAAIAADTAARRRPRFALTRGATRAHPPSRAGDAAGWTGFLHAGVLRWAVGISAVAQLLLALPALFAEPGTADVALHTGREMASFDVAVAIGFLFVAGRPAWARALVPVAVALAGCLLLTSSIDVVDGAAQLSHELNHLLAGVQAALVWLLARTDRTPTAPEPLPRQV